MTALEKPYGIRVLVPTSVAALGVEVEVDTYG
jgi:hypothetical protein